MEVSTPGNNRWLVCIFISFYVGLKAEGKLTGNLAGTKRLGIYLNDGLRQDVQAGRHNFFGILIGSFQSVGFEVDLFPNTEEERLNSEHRQGYSLFHLATPFHGRVLDIRLAYMYPFWRIEKEKWRENYRVAKLEFDPTRIDEEKARAFSRIWRRRLLSNLGQASEHRSHVLVALQGRLFDRRHGQSMAPIEMIQETLNQDRFRQVVIKLHPKEPYTDEELSMLNELEANPRIEFAVGDIHRLIENCDYIVTQNSSVAFKGLLQNTPSVLFAHSDFHHILESVNRDGAERAFRNILSKRMPYAKYFYWFLQLNTINAGRDEAAQTILENCRELGWQL